MTFVQNTVLKNLNIKNNTTAKLLFFWQNKYCETISLKFTEGPANFFPFYNVKTKEKLKKFII